MNSAYYIAMLLGVTWLCLWCAVPDAIRRRLWWPFDMRDAPRPGGEPAGPPVRGWRARAAAARTARAGGRPARARPPGGPRP